MLHTRLNSARRIAEALSPAEADIETAIISTSGLIGAIAEGRREARVAMTIGQESLAALGKTLEALVQARADMIAAHSALATDRVNAGLSAFGMGDVSDCPPASASLTLVEESNRSAA